MNPLDIKIEKGVPVPEGQPGRHSPWRRLLEKMSPGDSFVVDAEGEAREIQRKSWRWGLKVTTRQEGEKYRVWLVGRREVKKEAATKERPKSRGKAVVLNANEDGTFGVKE